MTKNPQKGPPKKSAKRGRPTRRQASAKALKNVDAGAVDPRQILREIASDRSAPASARLQAARALMRDGGEVASARVDEVDPIALRALKSLRGGSK